MEMFVVNFITNKGEELYCVFGDYQDAFIEHFARELLCVGIRRAKRITVKINNSKHQLKKYEKLLNECYNTNYKLEKAEIGETGLLWDYYNEDYYYPQ